MSTQAMSIANGIANGMSVRLFGQRAGWTQRARPSTSRPALVQPEAENRELDHARPHHRGAEAHVGPVHGRQHREGTGLGTLKKLQVTPITRTQLILGMIQPFVFIGYVFLTLLVVTMAWLFDIHIAGSIVWCFAANARSLASNAPATIDHRRLEPVIVAWLVRGFRPPGPRIRWIIGCSNGRSAAG
jgi:hypothetical protein